MRSDGISVQSCRRPNRRRPSRAYRRSGRASALRSQQIGALWKLSLDRPTVPASAQIVVLARSQIGELANALKTQAFRAIPTYRAHMSKNRQAEGGRLQMTDEMEIARKVQGNLRRIGVKSEITVTIGLALAVSHGHQGRSP